jgi:hypothetical protein
LGNDSFAGGGAMQKLRREFKFPKSNSMKASMTFSELC